MTLARGPLIDAIPSYKTYAEWDLSTWSEVNHTRGLNIDEGVSKGSVLKSLEELICLAGLGKNDS
jgi:hypothetical protein